MRNECAIKVGEMVLDNKQQKHLLSAVIKFNQIPEKYQLDSGLFEYSETIQYPEDYTECTEVAREELENGIRPELSGTVENMEQYDTIFVGCPVWWGDAPMPIWSFLESEEYNFTGKTVIPFCTYASTGRDATLQRIVALTPDSEHLEGFGTSGRNINGVEAWLREIGIIE